ncbi:hypothetical protein Hanom_Chr07g00633231 [Helianthus anomalus]
MSMSDLGLYIIWFQAQKIVFNMVSRIKLQCLQFWTIWQQVERGTNMSRVLKLVYINSSNRRN